MTISHLWTILFYGWTITEIYLVIATRTRKNEGQIKDRKSLTVLWITIFLAITTGEAIRAGMRPAFPVWKQGFTAAAIGILLLGVLIRWTAILSLGKAFSVNVAIRPTQTVYQGGLYRWMRHPSYTGLLLVFFAIGVETRNGISLLMILIPTTVALLSRIRIEEAALLEAFGAEYASYCQRTNRLIPSIY